MTTENTGKTESPRNGNSGNNGKGEKPLGFREKTRLQSALMRKNTAAYNMLLPFLVLFLIFTVIPIIILLPISFFELKLPASGEFAGLSNFRRLFSENDLFAVALKNTLLSLLVTGILGFLLNILAAWAVNMIKKPYRRIFALLLCLPSFMYGGYAVWSLILGEGANAPLNSLLMTMGVNTSAVDWLNSEYSPVITQLLNLFSFSGGTFGIGFLMIYSAMEELSENSDNSQNSGNSQISEYSKYRELYDAARIDGVSNRFSQLLLVTLPAISPTLAPAAVIQISVGLGSGSALTTTPANITVTDYMLMMGAGKFDVGMASAVGVLIAAFSTLVYFILRIAFRRAESLRG